MKLSSLWSLSTLFYLFTALFSLACVYPFVLVLTSSLTDEVELIRNGYSLFPETWSIAAYKAILSTPTIPRAYLVTIFTTVAGTLISLIVTSMIAYALSGRKLYYRNHINFIFYFTMLFNGGLVSFYILVTRYLQLTDSIWVYIIPFVLNPWNMFLMRNFFNEIPDELYESSRLEGAGEWRILWQIVLPLSLPALATIGLFYALMYWNSWQPALLFINNDKLFSLQYIIMQIIRNIDIAQNIAVSSTAGSVINTQRPPAFTVRLATAMVTIGPIIFLYPFLQRYFVGGLKIGAIKG
ncbi:sugar ABC transporter permease [Paenibacillus sp. MY03]|jgi:putative aldouronate transport system permease protein|uniref:carbohydrate ABC transporter permease n=1 Tax=Paenibacillus sp. MY03 TaxID=302980 RepID=UPI000B3C0E62|nr:carbohydrate ABC transporter permease [Paenibacillus sp. MY03]OUS78310.1 sugar ABC transporter permease [Paenibacillus sp. MY03]